MLYVLGLLDKIVIDSMAIIGKTESVKALAQCFGRQVLVFNCDEALERYCHITLRCTWTYIY